MKRDITEVYICGLALDVCVGTFLLVIHGWFAPNFSLDVCVGMFLLVSTLWLVSIKFSLDVCIGRSSSFLVLLLMFECVISILSFIFCITLLVFNGMLVFFKIDKSRKSKQLVLQRTRKLFTSPTPSLLS